MIEQLICKLSVILTDYLPWNYLSTVQLCMYGEGNTGLITMMKVIIVQVLGIMTIG